MNPPITPEQQRVNRIAQACLIFNALMADRQKRWSKFCRSFATKRARIQGPKVPREEIRRLTLAKAKAEAGL